MKTIICAVALLFSSAHAMGKIDETCPGQIDCDGTPCAENEFCNVLVGHSDPFCSPCAFEGHSEPVPCDERGLSIPGLEDCKACCGL